MIAVQAIRRRSLLVGAEAAIALGPSRVGGKAYALARLTAAGERVPEWAVLPADTLEMHLIAAGEMERVQRELDALAATAGDSATTARAAAVLQDIVDELLLDVGLIDALSEISTTLGGPFAVRSSAVGEDGDRLSFAGQFETVLGVAGRIDELSDALRKCWRSAFGARVLDYRRRSGTVSDAARLAVVIQRLVSGDASGVLFTLDPVTGDRTRMRVSACRGLGEALVSGAVDADEYVIRSDGAEIETRTAMDAAGRGGRVLERDALVTLAAVGRRIEEREGGPRDIEWTMLDGELWILQARPVTSMVRAAAPVEHRVVWDNSNIQESYCGVTTPLTFSFARAAYASVYEQTMRAVGVPAGTIAAHRPMLGNLLGLLHGRVYYNLNNWYRGLLLLPAFGRNKEDMERMMGVEEPVDFVTDDSPGVRERLRRVPRLARTAVGLLRAFATLDRDAATFLDEFDGRIRAVDRATLGQRSLG